MLRRLHVDWFWLSGIAIFACAVWAAVAAAEEITMTSYYPSPRGVYKELRAESYGPLDTEKPYELDMDQGRIRVSAVDLIDSTTGDVYTLRIQGGQLILEDAAGSSAYILFEEPAPPAP